MGSARQSYGVRVRPGHFWCILPGLGIWGCPSTLKLNNAHRLVLLQPIKLQRYISMTCASFFLATQAVHKTAYILVRSLKSTKHHSMLGHAWPLLNCSTAASTTSSVPFCRSSSTARPPAGFTCKNSTSSESSMPISLLDLQGL